MFPSQPVTTLIGAGLTAFVALMVVIITKEQKVSEFRQAWIDSLRSDVADAVASASTLTVVMQVPALETQTAMMAEWAKVQAALCRIDLRLNMKEDLHKVLERCIREAEVLIRRLEADSRDYDPAEWIGLQERVIAASRPLLKYEWNRVRKGETVYRITKGVLIGIPVLAVLGALMFSIA